MSKSFSFFLFFFYSRLLDCSTGRLENTVLYTSGGQATLKSITLGNGDADSTKCVPVCVLVCVFMCMCVLGAVTQQIA